jgi:Glycosyl transferase family 2
MTISSYGVIEPVILVTIELEALLHFRPTADFMAPSPLISVIIPIYNGEADIPDLLRCLQAQTYPADRVEYLIVDNGSADRTRDLLQAPTPPATRAFAPPKARSSALPMPTVGPSPIGYSTWWHRLQMQPSAGWRGKSRRCRGIVC